MTLAPDLVRAVAVNYPQENRELLDGWDHILFLCAHTSRRLRRRPGPHEAACTLVCFFRKVWSS